MENEFYSNFIQFELNTKYFEMKYLLILREPFKIALIISPKNILPLSLNYRMLKLRNLLMKQNNK